MRFLFCRNRDSVKNGILISIRRTGDGFHPGLFTLKTLGKERIDESIILSLKNRLPEAEKKKMLEEATGVSEWIYAVIRKVCAE